MAHLRCDDIVMAFHFTTVNRAFMDIPGGWQFSGPRLTLSAWIYHVSSPFNLRMVVGKYPGAGFQRLRWMIDENLHIEFAANWNAVYGAWTSTGIVPANAWRHICASGDGSDAKLAINGVIENKSGGGRGGINDSAAVPAGVGGSDDDGQYWTGWLAELAMWDFGPFPDSHIQALAAGANPMKIMAANLMGYWPLRGTSIPMADISGRGRHLTEHNVNADQYSDPNFHPPVQLAMV